ncbi:MAG: DUF4091 domain-containing protein [Clostridia bacterium]|nr:DUF4091 domain-containing protein [Clostridia bacterium]
MKLKWCSSLEKCFWDDPFEEKPEKTSFVMFANERLAAQFVYYNERPERPRLCEIEVDGPLAPYVEIRDVVSIPSMLPLDLMFPDERLLRNQPGLYPDLIRPLHYHGTFKPAPLQLGALFVTVKLPDGFAPGEYPLTVSVFSQAGTTTPRTCLGSECATVRVLKAVLPPQRCIHTEWFYTDCIANAYRVEAFSETHWKAIEDFMAMAVDSGINMILTPIFTPELDTYVGGERMTTQLLDITRTADGSYTFGFDRLDRWLEIARRVGVQYFEIPHFFSQWGAHNTPKIIANVDGEEKRIFGWETDALGEEYEAFLSAMIPAFVAHMKEKGLDKQCFYHISDEPKLENLAHYKKCKELISKYLGDYPIIDALSSYEFYETGALKKPVPFIGHIEPFLENRVKGLWAYYAGTGDCRDLTGRHFAMTLARTRILGVQLYMHRIEGFLHWGFNFYNNCRSYDVIDPFLCSDGEIWAPSGDTYLVYPGTDGKPWESLRLNAMREAMDDIRALELCESIHGRAFTERLVLEGTDGSLSFTHFPHDADYLLNLRERLASAIEEE